MLTFFRERISQRVHLSIIIRILPPSSRGKAREEIPRMAQSLRRMVAQRQDQKPVKTGETGFWPEICARVNVGSVIPIISNALRNDWIFEGPPGGAPTGGPPADEPQQTV